MDRTDLVVRLGAALAAYLVGSIPFSYLVARRRGVDVRAVGSGNVGATNVMRSVGRGAGLLAFALDFLKGLAGAQLGRMIEPQGPLPAVCAVMAVLGHMYPVWLRFQGGKGVATGAGAFLPLAPIATAVALVVFAATLALTRYVSLGSMVGAVTLAATAALTGAPRPVWIAAAVMAALIVWKHRANIRRVAAGTESRLGRRVPAGR
jgi:glycerol-3-phosphate acyltransferase PlsY